MEKNATATSLAECTNALVRSRDCADAGVTRMTYIPIGMHSSYAVDQFLKNSACMLMLALVVESTFHRFSFTCLTCLHIT